ncbi:hypothetical protein pdam_00007138 [Pocillopora damicornis]|uniref:C2H2-type domain-containing protein n=1 Tax=Pocillopora damicornis TaxID=46731 RepID=A0A3M6TEI0_POCDA|nr:hypothetical protein pdam_00007138 [Pocillopora damicornis]
MSSGVGLKRKNASESRGYAKILPCEKSLSQQEEVSRGYTPGRQSAVRWVSEKNEELSDIAEEAEKQTNPGSSATGDVAIQCNLEANADSYIPRTNNGRNQPVPFPALDTRGLHTLAELCLRRADYEFCTQNVTVDHRKINDGDVHETELNESETFKEPRKVHDTKFKRRVSDSLTSVKREQVNVEENETAEEKCEDLKERKSKAMRRSMNPVNENNSTRLHKLEEELEKMLQGKEEIIGREIRDFMENNKALEKELIEETGVSQIEITKYLQESVHLKEDKRTKLFRWYLEKKLSRVESDDESYTCYKCGKIFAYESYLERHVKYVCPDKTGRTWKCSYCSKAFQYPCYLRRHMRSHTGK